MSLEENIKPKTLRKFLIDICKGIGNCNRCPLQKSCDVASISNRPIEMTDEEIIRVFKGLKLFKRWST